jgi:HupE / UreJ protein
MLPPLRFKVPNVSIHRRSVQSVPSLPAPQRRTPSRAASPVEVAPDQDGVVASLTWSCKEVQGDIVYRSKVLIDIDRAAKQIVLIGSGPNASQTLLDATQTDVRLTAAPTALIDVVKRYVNAGIEHILLGYDHIAFLIAIVLWARRLWPVIKIVTAFTVAHSITLSLAALQIVLSLARLSNPPLPLLLLLRSKTWTDFSAETV